MDSTQQHNEINILPIESPSEWSYDAPTRCLHSINNINNTNNTNTKTKHVGYNGYNGPILHLLNTCQFSPFPEESIESIDESTEESTIESIISFPESTRTIYDKKIVDAANKTHMMAGLVLLCISGILNAGSIAYVNWLNHFGFNMPEIIMYEGLFQVILCFIFGIITAKCISQVNLKNSNHGLRRNASFKSLVLPFSMEYNVNLVKLFKTNNIQKKIYRKYTKYGATSDGTNNINFEKIENTKSNEIGFKQLMIAIFAFGVTQFASHLTFFDGYLRALSTNHYEIAPLFNSLSIGLAFLWSYLFYRKHNEYHSKMTTEIFLYLFLMYIGVIILCYSFIEHSDGFGLLLRISNIYLILSAFLESLGYVLIKYANCVPTFILVFSQSVFCAILGLILYETSSDSFKFIKTFQDLIEVSSIGLIGFCSTWTFVRGTQLISIGIASFFKMTVFIIFSIIIQVFSIDAQIPHFYCIFGLCLIVLSIVLMLIEKFSKTK